MSVTDLHDILARCVQYTAIDPWCFSIHHAIRICKWIIAASLACGYIVVTIRAGRAIVCVVDEEVFEERRARDGINYFIA